MRPINSFLAKNWFSTIFFLYSVQFKQNLCSFESKSLFFTDFLPIRKKFDTKKIHKSLFADYFISSLDCYHFTSHKRYFPSPSHHQWAMSSFNVYHQKRNINWQIQLLHICIFFIKTATDVRNRITMFFKAMADVGQNASNKNASEFKKIPIKMYYTQLFFSAYVGWNETDLNTRIKLKQKEHFATSGKRISFKSKISQRERQIWMKFTE